MSQPDHVELQQRVLTQSQSVSPDDYAFTRTVRSEATWNGKSAGNKLIVETFDPSKPTNARWALVSVNGAPPSRAELRHYLKEAGKRRAVPGYHRLASYFGAVATTSIAAGGKTLFHFAALPKDSVSILEKDFSQHARAEVSVSQANGESFAEQVRITIEPMRKTPLARVNAFETVTRYRLEPGGLPFLIESTSELTGSLMGMKGEMHTTVSYSDYRAVGSSPRL